MQEPETKEVEVTAEITRYDCLPLPMKVVFTILSAGGLILSFSFVFNIPIGGYTMLNFSYFFVFIGIFSSLLFLILPGRKKDRNRVPWYDYLMFIATMGICYYFFRNAEETSVEVERLVGV